MRVGSDNKERQKQTYCDSLAYRVFSESLLSFFRIIYSNRQSKNAETPADREATPDPPNVDISAHHNQPKNRQKGPPRSSLRSSSLADAQRLQSLLFGVVRDQSDLDLGPLMMENNMPSSRTGRTGSSQEVPMLQVMHQLMGDARGPGGVDGLGGLGGPRMGMGIPPPETQQTQQGEYSSVDAVEGITCAE